jgi:predicted aldo/keto reductase-like oxidoreductase
MPVFSCGGMRYQDGWNDKPLSEIDPKTQVNLEATIHRALDAGINHIETARGYGCSERQLGQLFPKLERDKLIIQTKVGPEADSDVFYKNVLDSLERLQLDSVDLLGIHGINNQEKYDWTTRPGGCFEMAQRLRREGRCRFIGFSTHGSVEIINKAIAYTEPKTGESLDYVNLHWYYIYQETQPCIAAATARDMGVFIISPSDKGGQLYKAPPRLHELCAPLHPMTFNDLFCLVTPQIHTLSIGAARPSDFEEHLDALPLLNDQTPALLEPILKRLADRYAERVEPELRDPWGLGLPPIKDIPGQINVGRIVQLRNLARAYDMTDYAKFRYNLLGNAADWFPGQQASPDNLNAVRPALESLFTRLPAGKRLLSIIEEAHELLADKEVKRLSES